jgi:transposase-like protein
VPRSVSTRQSLTSLDGKAPAGKRNSRNGYSKKTVLTETSKLDLRIPRDREGTSIRS